MKFGPAFRHGRGESARSLAAFHGAAWRRRRRLRKGHPLTDADIARLRAAGETEVIVARLDPGDVGEDAAAARIGRGAGARPGRARAAAVAGVHRPGQPVSPRGRGCCELDPDADRAAERGGPDDHAGDPAAVRPGGASGRWWRRSRSSPTAVAETSVARAAAAGGAAVGAAAALYRRHADRDADRPAATRKKGEAAIRAAAGARWA